MNRNILWTAVCTAVASLLYGCGYLNTALVIVTSVISAILGVVAGLSMVLCTGKMERPSDPNIKPMVSTLLLTKMVEERQKMNTPQRKLVMSVNLDMVIHSIFDLVMRDYVMSWYSTIAKNEKHFYSHVEKEVWYMLEQFGERMGKIDKVHFMTKPVVQKITKHFKTIRQTTTESDSGEKQKFFLHPWLASDERETEFLRKVADVFLIYLMPEPYSNCPSVRHLLREVVACKVFKQAVDLICDPDYFNTKVLGWFEYREQLAMEHTRTYTYAATYEDFMQKIKECNDLEHLRQMRYNIISEIMQATTIQNLKRAKGLDTEKESVPTGTSKGDLLKARNLTRYINQLTVTKAACEKRIHWLGGPDYSSYTADRRRKEHQNMPGKKILAFNLIMENATVRNYFLKYLHKDGNDALLRFWTAVENLKLSHRKEWHAMASEIYQMFITHPTSLIRLRLTRGLIKSMEAFMTGDTGPEAFYDAQTEIYHILEEEHYPSFILSDIYHKCITTLDDNSRGTDSDSDDKKRLSGGQKRSPDHEAATAKFAEQSTYAQQKLHHLDNKILNKTQAVQALKSSQKPDPKIKKLQAEIEGEIEKLKSDRRQLEFHIDRTEVWAENIGRWKAHIYNSEVVQEDDKMVAYFVIVIHLSGTSTVQPKGISGYTQGWVISRKLADFRALHQQIIQISPDISNIEIPEYSNRWTKTISTDFLNKAQEQLKLFLLTVLQDERLAQSEATYAFFSPSPEHLKQAPSVPKRTKFSLTNLFKGMSGSAQQDSDSDDELLFVDEEEWKEEHGKDYIAKPMYLLINEVFELRGMFKWLRRTLMAFVKVSFGRSINRQIRDTVGWIVSEPMMIYYLEQFRDAYWPDGKLAEDLVLKTDEQKLHTRLKTKEKFLAFTTESLKGLVGERNARRGSVKFFEAMQDTRLNKHLFYELLEVFLLELFPELGEHRQNWKSDGTDSAPETDSAVLQQQLAASNMISGF